MGLHVPELTDHMVALLQSSITSDRVLDLVVAWEDVNKCVYNPLQPRFLQRTDATLPSSAPQGALPELSSLHQEIKEMRD